MKLLLDMNRPPQLVGRLQEAGYDAAHWANIGDPAASDAQIMLYARQHGYVHDLDFGALLAATQAVGPSVVQIRCVDVLAERYLTLLLNVLARFAESLRDGALVTVDESRQRARILPFG